MGSQAAGKKRGSFVTCQMVCNRLSEGRPTSLPTADQRWQWYLREPLMEIYIWTPGLRTQGHKPTSMKRVHSAPQGDKVVTEGCGGSIRRRGGAVWFLRVLLVQSAMLFRFTSQCQGPGIEVQAMWWNQTRYGPICSSDPKHKPGQSHHRHRVTVLKHHFYSEIFTAGFWLLSWNTSLRWCKAAVWDPATTADICLWAIRVELLRIITTTDTLATEADNKSD